MSGFPAKQYVARGQYARNRHSKCSLLALLKTISLRSFVKEKGLKKMLINFLKISKELF